MMNLIKCHDYNTGLEKLFVEYEDSKVYLISMNDEEANEFIYNMQNKLAYLIYEEVLKYLRNKKYRKEA